MQVSIICSDVELWLARRRRGISTEEGNRRGFGGDGGGELLGWVSFVFEPRHTRLYIGTRWREKSAGRERRELKRWESNLCRVGGQRNTAKTDVCRVSLRSTRQRCTSPCSFPVHTAKISRYNGPVKRGHESHVSRIFAVPVSFAVCHLRICRAFVLCRVPCLCFAVSMSLPCSLFRLCRVLYFRRAPFCTCTA
jgi:hypothetical protein